MASEQGASRLHQLAGSVGVLLVFSLLPTGLAAQVEARTFRFDPRSSPVLFR